MIVFSFVYDHPFCSVWAEDVAKAIKSSNPINNTTGEEVPVSTAAIKSGAIRKTMKIFRTIVIYS
jgi:hypothetical protein